jgi:uncharacterized DUF497 family protein
MYIKKVLISQKTHEKIFDKHGIKLKEVEQALLENTPRFFKTRDGRYLALAFQERYLTMVFEYHQGTVEVITAYPSAEWQIRLYKRKK